MTATNLKSAFSSPESRFRNPQYVLRDSDLSYDDKIAVLRDWKSGLVGAIDILAARRRELTRSRTRSYVGQ
jgi:hypothetical protein